jgi:transposase
MPRLTEVQRDPAIALLMQGQRQQQVALQFGLNVSTIERLVRHLRDTGRVDDRPRRGRPRVTTPRQDRPIHIAHLRNRHVTATETALTTVGNYNRHIHPKTVRNQLHEFRLRARRPYIDFPLTRGRREHRMAWLAAHDPKQFPMRQWKRVFFTDEPRFTLFRPDGRHRGERFTDACVLERDRFKCGSVMVWGGISHGLKSLLIVIADNLTGVRYRDEILWPVAVPSVQQHHLIFQQDNVRPHVARVCQDFLANHNINPLDWLPYSSDLSPIEHLWEEMDRRVRGRRNAPATLDQLRAALMEVG